MPDLMQITNDEMSDNDSVEHSNPLTHPAQCEHPDLLPGTVFMTEEQHRHADIVPEDVDVQLDTPQAELLAWHYRLGHLPSSCILNVAKQGDLPWQLLR